MKKLNLLYAFILSTFSISLVSAQNLPAPMDVGPTIASLFNALLSNQAYYSLSSEVIARVLVFILLFAITYVSADKIFPDQKKSIPTIVAFIVSLMAVRYLTSPMIEGLFLPYEALGIILSIAIPFALFEGFMLTGGKEFATPIKALFYYIMIGIFVSLWWTRWTNIGDLAWYYLVAAVITLLFYMFSNSLESWLIMSNVKDSSKRGILLAINDSQIKLREAALKVNGLEGEELEVQLAEVKNIRKSIDHLYKQL